MTQFANTRRNTYAMMVLNGIALFASVPLMGVAVFFYWNAITHL